MPLIINRQWVQNDPWTRVEADTDGGLPRLEPLSAVWLSWTTFDQHRAACDEHPGPLGIEISNDMDLALLEPDLSRFAMIALTFPSVADGRAFSLAKLLRQLYGFEGQLRAVGYVTRDRLPFMERCGFDAMTLTESLVSADDIAAFSEISQPYQQRNDCAHKDAL